MFPTPLSGQFPLWITPLFTPLFNEEGKGKLSPANQKGLDSGVRFLIKEARMIFVTIISTNL